MNGHKRTSRQRQVILEVLQSTTSHPPAEWVHSEARKRLPRLSLGTTYRNLRVLAETGAIQEMGLGSDCSRYDGNPSPHAHFFCDRCGRVLDIADPTPPDLDSCAARGSGLKIASHRLTFYGLCPGCQKENATECLK